MTDSASVLPPPAGRARAASGTRSYRSWIWAGGVLVALGVIAVVGWIIYGVVEVDRTVDDMVRAREGTVTEFTLDSPRSWTVYVEPQSATVSGVRFSLIDEDGNRVEMRPYGGDLTYSVTGHSGRAIATVALDVGVYQLVVDGSGPRSVAMGPSIGGRLVRIFVGSIVLGVLLIGGGAVLMIVGALRQSRARNRTYDRPAPSPWSTGEWQGTGRRGPAQ